MKVSLMLGETRKSVHNFVTILCRKFHLIFHQHHHEDHMPLIIDNSEYNHDNDYEKDLSAANSRFTVFHNPSQPANDNVDSTTQ